MEGSRTIRRLHFVSGLFQRVLVTASAHFTHYTQLFPKACTAATWNFMLAVETGPRTSPTPRAKSVSAVRSRQIMCVCISDAIWERTGLAMKSV